MLRRERRARGNQAWSGVMRYLVTGGAGFIGSHIVDQLVDEGRRTGGVEVRVLDDLSRGTRRNLAHASGEGSVTVIEGDIRDRGVVARAVEGVDVVLHQAALRITQCAEEPRRALEVMVDGTFNVLDASRQAGVEKLVVASSASVYGAADVFPTPEDHHPYNNRTLYGAAKAFGEGLLRSLYDTAGLGYVALRYFNVYGPRMDAAGKYTEVLIRWMQRIADGRPPVIFGDGLQTVDLVFVEDAARANILAARSSVADDVFNVASGAETSLNDLARLLLRTMGSDVEPEYAAPRAVNPVPRRLGDTRKAEAFLGFKAQVPLEEGIRRLVHWWRREIPARVD